MKHCVFYRKDSTFWPDKNLVMKDLFDPSKFKYVLKRDAEDLEETYMEMQAENWSLNGEARNIIKGLGLNHTSMSVGDAVLVLSPIGHLCFQCDVVRWKPFFEAKRPNLTGI